jgi:hypothetical protein
LALGLGRQLLLTGVAVEKLPPGKIAKTKSRQGCAINDVLDFGGHFLSLGWDSFFKRGSFSTATGVYTN